VLSFPAGYSASSGPSGEAKRDCWRAGAEEGPDRSEAFKHELGGARRFALSEGAGQLASADASAVVYRLRDPAKLELQRHCA